MKTLEFCMRLKGESGNSMLGLLAVMTISLAVVSGLLGNAASTSKVKAITDDRSDQFYEVEDAIGKANAWLQDHSAHFISAFSKDNFSNNFKTDGPASPGTNDGDEFQIPTTIKYKVGGDQNTTISALLSNNESFGVSYFPTTTSMQSGFGAFNAASEFAVALAKPANVNVNVRAVLVWAIPNGAEHNPDYAPIFRIDAITGNNPDRGVHAFAYSEATLSRVETIAAPTTLFGFFGQDLFQAGGSFLCKSMKFNKSGVVWTAVGNGTNGCVVGSDTYVNMTGNGSAIHGTVLSNGTIGNLSNNTRANSTSCEGANCHNFALPTFKTWAQYASDECGGTVIATKNGTLDNGNCFENVGPTSNTITLRKQNEPYYVKNLNLANNAKIVIQLQNDDDKIRLFVENIKNGSSNHNLKINANTRINHEYRPMNLEINYFGSGGTISINGNAQARAVLNAPLMNVSTSGNHTWYGAIRAKRLTVTGNSTFYFDQDIQNADAGGSGIMELSGATFSLRKTSQRYR